MRVNIAQKTLGRLARLATNSLPLLWLAAPATVWVGAPQTAMSQSVAVPPTLGGAANANAEVQALLAQSRDAMRRGDLATADFYLSQAEAKPYQSEGLMAKFADSPQRLRQDFELLRKQMSQAATAMPAQVANQAVGQMLSANQQPLNPFRAPVAPDQALGFAQSALRDGNTSIAIQAYADAVRGQGSAPQFDAQLKSAHDELVARGVSNQQIDSAINAANMLNNNPALAAQSALQAGQTNAMLPPSLMPGTSGVVQASASAAFPPASANGNNAVVPAFAGANPANNGGVQPGVFNPQQDNSRTQVASATSPSNIALQNRNASGEELFQQGMQALTAGNRDAAVQLFSQAWQYQGEMDPTIRQQLKDKLTLLQAARTPAPGQGMAEDISTLDQVSQEQELLRQKLFREVTGQLSEASRTRESDPLGTLERLQTLRMRVSQSPLDGQARKQFLTMVDRELGSQQAFVDQNRPTIDLNLRNRQIQDRIELDVERKTKVEQEIASMVEQFNDLMKQRRYAEAEVIARQVGELDPNSLISSVLFQNARLARRILEQDQIQANKENGFADAMLAVDEASTPMDDRNPYMYGDAQDWKQLTALRARILADQRSPLNAAERDIQDKLAITLAVQFDQVPLVAAMEKLSNMTGVPIVLDPAGLASEGMDSSQPVSLNIAQPISFKSILNLLLGPKNLGYVIRDEVLQVTSRQQMRKNVYNETYYVKDLVIPIPNFVTDYNTGMGGAINAAYQAQTSRLLVQTAGGNSSMANMAMNQNGQSLSPDSPVLGQMAGMQGYGSQMMPPMGAMGGVGGGPGLGGGSFADFSSLISLIQSTIQPESWGLESTIQPYQTNLSIVVSATQEVHEEIADLLDSLRRLQNVQVTIEVRFITLNDNFFERVGVDFDFSIADNAGKLPQENGGSSVAIGISGPNTATGFTPTADLDLKFSQDGFTSTRPTIGGFDAGTAATFGFAILSDIDMFFFMEAAQGDARTNVLQAPKVTLFDGQIASVNDTVNRPFVTSVVPIVGDFAVAQQPVVVVLNEGTNLNVQAVVSPDKRFVRMTLIPMFTQIQRVDTFTFEGRRTSSSTTTVLDGNGDPVAPQDGTNDVIEGTTIQQPVFSTTNVSTTVNVPDGGTILLGGVKRLRESRTERGVPMLSKIPYINRLFKNVGIGRETSTLMMTVTPRIIIQEEEEEKLLGTATR